MKYALIGCSRIAANHIKAAIQNELEIAALCDIVPDKAADLLQPYELQNDPSIKRYSDYRQMIEENEIDLVSIATGSGLHAPIALYCIEHKINVIIEKPMAMSIADADRIIEAAEKNGVKVSVCHQNRFNLAVQKMRGAVEEGRFGKLSHGAVHIRWNRNRQYYEQAPWRGTWEQDGGTLMNQCIHGIDLLRWMMGDEIVEVYGKTCRQFHDYLEAEDLGMAIVTFRSGAIATIEGTTNVYPRNLEETLYLFGERGTAKLSGKSTDKIEVWEFADQVERDTENQNAEKMSGNRYGKGHVSLFADMKEAIEQNRKPYIDAHAGKAALELVLAIYQSAAEGKPVKLPLKSCGTLDFKGRFSK